MKGANPARRQELNDGQRLWVQEVFYTLQGEGPFSGEPSVFVRLAGCNLRCYFCDTDFESSQWQPSLQELIDRVESERPQFCDLVVITGGEPFRQNIGPLVERLLNSGLRVQIETNGTLFVDLPQSDRLFIVCSPKTPSLHPQIIPRVHAYKYVIASGQVSEADGLPSCSTHHESQPAAIFRPQTKDGIFVMPMDAGCAEATAENTAAAVDSALKFGHRLTLQTHKLTGIR